MSAAILSVGGRAPVGLNALQLALCGRAGLFAPRSSGFVSRRGYAVGVGRLRSIGDDVRGFERLRALGGPALRECLRGASARVAVFLGLPSAARPDADARLDGLLDTLAHDVGASVDLARSRALRMDGSGAATLFEAAAAHVAATGEPAVVGAIDSHHHPDVVRWLDEERRLHEPGNDDATIPSEGAAFALLGDPRREQRPALAAVLATRRGEEPQNDPTAVGLTRAVREVLAATATERCDWVLADLTGERARSRAFGFAWTRTEALQAAEVERLPALFGDTGAAAGPLALVYATRAWQAGVRRPSRALAVLPGEGRESAAFVLERAPAARRAR